MEREHSLRAKLFVNGTILALSLVFAAPAVVQAAVDPAADGEVIVFSRGDLDGNGIVEQTDLVLGIEFHFGVRSLHIIEALDIKDDGVIDIADLQVISRIVYGITPYDFPKERVAFKRGDLDDDGRYTHRDAALLDDYLAGTGAVPAPLDSADVNHDGAISIEDRKALEDLIPQTKQPDPAKPVDPGKPGQPDKPGQPTDPETKATGQLSHKAAKGTPGKTALPPAAGELSSSTPQPKSNRAQTAGSATQ